MMLQRGSSPSRSCGSHRATETPVHANDFQATVLHLLGIEHTRFTHRFQGRDFRLTDIGGELVRGILA
jgi:hypothetical protein